MNDIAANKETARRYLELIAKGDASGVADLFTEDGAIILESDTPMPAESRGRDAIYGLISQLPAIFPETGLRILVDGMTAEDDRVAIQAHSDATHVSGQKYANRYHFLLRFRDGKIVASHEYMDTLHMTRVFFGAA